MSPLELGVMATEVVILIVAKILAYEVGLRPQCTETKGNQPTHSGFLLLIDISGDKPWHVHS